MAFLSMAVFFLPADSGTLFVISGLKVVDFSTCRREDYADDIRAAVYRRVLAASVENSAADVVDDPVDGQVFAADVCA